MSGREKKVLDKRGGDGSAVELEVGLHFRKSAQTLYSSVNNSPI